MSSSAVSDPELLLRQARTEPAAAFGRLLELYRRYLELLARVQIGRRLQAVAEKLCGGSLTPLVTNLIRSHRLTARERREIRALIDELEEKN